MSTWRRATAAAMSVLLAAGIGFLTNVLTARWNVAVAVALGALIVLGCATQVYLTSGDRRTGTAETSTPGQKASATGGGIVVQAGRDVINSGDLRADSSRPNKAGNADG